MRRFFTRLRVPRSAFRSAVRAPALGPLRSFGVRRWPAPVVHFADPAGRGASRLRSAALRGLLPARAWTACGRFSAGAVASRSLDRVTCPDCRRIARVSLPEPFVFRCGTFLGMQFPAPDPESDARVFAALVGHARASEEVARQRGARAVPGGRVVTPSKAGGGRSASYRPRPGFLGGSASASGSGAECWSAPARWWTPPAGSAAGRCGGGRIAAAMAASAAKFFRLFMFVSRVSARAPRGPLLVVRARDPRSAQRSCAAPGRL